ncbi:MAG: hypothetical protein ACTSPK_04120 [Candidatus Heimdallarchaeota archaeon]
MYSYVSLKCNCTECGKSLMDPKELIDDIPSIKLKIKDNGNDGTINLSSFYGSYNYKSSLFVKLGDVYKFACPKCKAEITSEVECEECNATMIPMKIRDGGTVRFCSRAGCKKHNVEFEDISNVCLYMSNNIGDPAVVEIHDKFEKEVETELIKSGTFLRIYCPHCENGLIEKNSVVFKIKNEYKEQGFLLLSPYLNVFRNKSTIFIPDGATATEITCPYCDKDLISEETKCEACGSLAVNVDVAALRRMIDFFFCSKKGCNWHSLSSEDIQHVMLEDSVYW